MPKHEMLDLVTPEGMLTGEQADKVDIHEQGLWHRDVHVWITDGDHLLQQQRAWDKKIMPGAWDITVGEHVAAGETFLEAAKRGAAEELGLDLPAERFIPAGTLAVEMLMQPGPDEWMHRTHGDNFVVVERNLQIADLVLQTSEVIAARWYPIDQLETDIASPDTAGRHAPQPPELWTLGIAAMRQATALA